MKQFNAFAYERGESGETVGIYQIEIVAADLQAAREIAIQRAKENNWECGKVYDGPGYSGEIR